MEPARIVQETLVALFGDTYGTAMGVRLWDGTRVEGSRQRFTLVVAHPGALRTALRAPFDLSAGRAFAAGLLDCEGDIEAAVDALLNAVAGLTPRRAAHIWLMLRRLPRARLARLREARLRGGLHSRARDLAAIGFHYDLPLPFYATFLDSHLIYSCAYYDDGLSNLETAQLAKLDHTLRKLRLAPGERLLDIGCGWGALVIRAAQAFGARALGITLSRSQYEEGNRRIDAAGLRRSASIELRDYRDLGDERFDKVASIGMFEHVGRAKLPEYFRAAYRALRPGGLFLNHGIAAEGPAVGRRATSFMERFVFPDGELVRIAEALAVAQDAGFEVRDVENLREHYARTLRAWVANLERHRTEAVDAAGEQSYRIWRLYLAGSAQGFRSARIAIYQSLLARPRGDGTVDLPPTRRDLYA
ncbi:MAG TPA: cyclopropane-fatty-acyl-phospholipid synthase family protein [Candidatus Dormibacteraeota bacterium]|nr:cyclopropane-fatty-acyl-phospholipid synthase family protein [Candidatus Dormibacteraeota bacterium]